MELNKKKFIGVIGPSAPDEKNANLAYEVGREIALHNAILVCGGLGGVMHQAAKGAKEAGGLTIGILPENEKSTANPYIDIPIATGLGDARNLIIVLTSDVLIAIGKSYGTLSEIALALKANKPVLGLNTWDLDSLIIKVFNPKEAVKKAIALCQK